MCHNLQVFDPQVRLFDGSFFFGNASVIPIISGSKLQTKHSNFDIYLLQCQHFNPDFLCLVCLPGVSLWLCGSSSRCHGFVCGL